MHSDRFFQRVRLSERGAMATSLQIILVERSKTDARRIMDTIRQGGLAADFHHVTSVAALPELLAQGTAGLVITAFSIEEASALEVIDLVRRSPYDLPIIVVSDAVGEDMAVTVMHAGAHDFITKQNLTRLVPAIERELEELAIHRERKAAVAALRESELRFRQLAENIGEVFWLLDPQEHRLIYLSPAYEEVWERSAEVFLSQPDKLLETVYPEDYHRVQECLASHGWAGFNDEYRIVLPDGNIRWINTRSFPILNNEGEVYRVAGLSIDVTRSKQLEDEKEMMSRALEQSADAVIITDEKGVIVYVNPAFEDTTGYSREEALGRYPSLLKSGLQDEAYYAQMWQCLTSGAPFTDVFINRRKDGELYFEAKTITPVYSSNGGVTHYVSTGKDITQRLKTRERFYKLLHYDAVTGLASKILLQDRLNQAILQASRHNGALGVICVGLEFSELLGAVKGKVQTERLLRSVGQRLLESLDNLRTVARVDNDKFIILLKNVESHEEFEQVAKDLVLAFSEPVVTSGYELYLSPSIGISVYPQDGAEAELLIEHAELAMKLARRKGHNNYLFYQGDMRAKSKSLLS